MCVSPGSRRPGWDPWVASGTAPSAGLPTTPGLPLPHARLTSRSMSTRGCVSLWTVCVRAAGGLASHCPQGRAGNAAMEWQGPGVPSGVVVDKHLNLCEP